MNYRHSFHAGNSADVVKHCLLIALVRALQLKDSALTLIDTHSGCGLYDLHGDEAGRTGEAMQGVVRALAASSPLLDDYRAAVRAVNEGMGEGAQPRLYPGSPRFLAQLLRPQDALILNEKHPEDAAALRAAMRGTPAAVHQRDAYELWLALLPTRTPRGLVLVDPPYELKSDYAKVVELLVDAHRRWATGVYLLWFPVLSRLAAQRLLERMAGTGIPRQLCIQYLPHEGEAAANLLGSGVLVINPPFRLDAELTELAGVLAEGVPGRARVLWSVPE